MQGRERKGIGPFASSFYLSRLNGPVIQISAVRRRISRHLCPNRKPCVAARRALRQRVSDELPCVTGSTFPTWWIWRSAASGKVGRFSESKLCPWNLQNATHMRRRSKRRHSTAPSRFYNAKIGTELHVLCRTVRRKNTPLVIMINSR